jgi:hypothetical protein
MVSEASFSYLKLFRFYQQGVLPLSGGVLEQPDKFIKAMQVIERQYNSE